MFGGQVAGQALVAAARTVDAEPAASTRCTPTSCGPATRRCRSSTRSTASATASRSPPAASSPSSTARRSSTCRRSFHVHEDGPRPPVPDAAGRARPRDAARLHGPAWAPYKDALGRLVRPAPPDRHPLRRLDAARSQREPLPPYQRVWLRADGRLPDDPVLHACVVTYASDMTLLDTTLLPHGVQLARRRAA